MNLAVSAANRRLVLALAAGSVLFGTPAVANEACRARSGGYVTVSGTIHGPRTEIRPIYTQDGRPDYSIVETIDEYELTSAAWRCGNPLLVRFRYGHVKAAGCADGVKASVSGIYQEARGEERAHLEVMSPSDLKCGAENG